MLLGFKKRFVSPIQGGSKIHTVRNFRKVKPKIGETLYMYTGLRTSNCELITNKEILKGEQLCRIHFASYKYIRIYVDDRLLSNEETNDFVVNDGFKDLEDFKEWWFQKTTTLPAEFIGPLFHWTDFKY